MGRPRKNPVAPSASPAVAPVAVETVPESLKAFGGDFTFAQSMKPGIDPATLVNDSDYNLHVGDIVLKAAPETLLTFCTIDNTPGLEHTKTLVRARRNGWTECRAEDFYLSERAQLVFAPDPSGRLTVMGDTQNTLVLYCRSKERFDAAMKYNRRFTEDVGKSAEEKMAELGGRLQFAGMTPTLIEETVDANGNVLGKRTSDFLSKVF